MLSIQPKQDLDYSELNKNVESIKNTLETCMSELEKNKSTERSVYQNPLYRLWSGDVRDLAGFAERLEEWLSQPHVAEAKRYLADLADWSGLDSDSPLESIVSDWKFLSGNIKGIEDIHRKLEVIHYESIRRKASAWILERTSAKDMVATQSWAGNAAAFAQELKDLEGRKPQFALSEEVKRQLVRGLLETSSFDKDRTGVIGEHRELVDRAETMVGNRPPEIKETALLRSYRILKAEGIEERLAHIAATIERIRGLLIGLEWVKEMPIPKEYRRIWADKRKAVSKATLESVEQALIEFKASADRWKRNRKAEVVTALITIDRMLRSLEEWPKDDLDSLKRDYDAIEWDKPDPEVVVALLSRLYKVEEGLRGKLVEKLKNDDAIAIIKEPQIVNYLGSNKGWDLDRFIAALEVVLRAGLIEIKAAEE